MTDAGAWTPNFKTYAEGAPIPPVDPEDLKRRWNIKVPWTLQDLQETWSHEADSSAVSSRWQMIDTLIVYKLLTPWQHANELDDAVFRIAATFPLRELKLKSYKIPGDERFGFDPNAFVQQLVEETGITHVWEPVATKVPEGGRDYVTMSANFAGQVRDPEREAKRKARELVWSIWQRCAPSLDQVLSNIDKENAPEVVATFFADFLMDNIDLVRQLADLYRAGKWGAPLELWYELERRAQRSV
jgi:hypothetical protein